MLRRIAIRCLVALFSFATAPAGFMPGAAAGGPALLICPGSTAIGNGSFASRKHFADQTRAMAGHHDHHHAAPSKSDDQPEAAAGNSFCDNGTQAQADVPPDPAIFARALPFARIEVPLQSAAGLFPSRSMTSIAALFRSEHPVLLIVTGLRLPA